MALEAVPEVIPEAALEAECADKIRERSLQFGTDKSRAANGMAAEWETL